MIYILIVLVIFLTENKIKQYIEDNKVMHKSEKIFNGKIILERYHNRGIMLNYMQNNVQLVKIICTSLLGILVILFALVIPKKGNHLFKFGLSLLLGGAISNVYDRYKRGYVVDYFSFKFLKKIVFNISDICIFMGSFIVAIYSFLKRD